jgi:hypothetical protein
MLTCLRTYSQHCTVYMCCMRLLLQFESQVSHAMQQVKGDVHLSVPSNINIDDPEVSWLSVYTLMNNN